MRGYLLPLQNAATLARDCRKAQAKQTAPPPPSHPTPTPYQATRLQAFHLPWLRCFFHLLFCSGGVGGGWLWLDDRGRLVRDLTARRGDVSDPLSNFRNALQCTIYTILGRTCVITTAGLEKLSHVRVVLPLQQNV